MKKMITTLLLAAAVLMPSTGAFASIPNEYADAIYGSYSDVKGASKFQYADAVYGSFAALKKAVPNTTMEDYKRFNDKMASVLDTLGAADFTKFQALVKEMTAITLPYYDENGQLDASKMTPEDRAQFDAVVAQLQPYFERLG